ncbi:stalk domain-containing protein [Cohnella terricola]|uniref:stalk domain-containing protein n=1 Tax=Cohnella terricola TaxID=1289167 RepID=UPI00319E7EB0
MFASMGAGVYAGSNLQEIKAYLNSGLHFKANGSPVQLVDANGSPVLPITYNGSTYLPVRAIADALKVAVDYDSKTGMIQLGEKSEGVAIAAGFDSMYHTKDPAKTSYNGKDYKDVYFDNESGGRSSSFILHPKKKFQKLYLQVAATGKDIENLVVKDSDTSTELKQQAISIADGLATIEVDIGGVDTLFIHTELESGGGLFVPLTTSYYK